MKKRTTLLLTMLSIFILSACGKQAGTSISSNLNSANEQNPEDAQATDTLASDDYVIDAADKDQSASPQKIEPIPATLSIDSLDNHTFAASFEASDVKLDDDGALVVHLTAYDYEKFDAAKISSMSEGDTLVIDGKEISVNTKVTNEYGLVSINGGFEENGYDLFTDDDGYYYESTMDIGRNYYAIGDTTLKIGQDFVYLDDTDPEHQGLESYAGDFLMAMEDSTESFHEYDTTITMKDGWLINVHKIFMP